MVLEELDSKYANLEFISMEDLITTQEWLESEFKACRDLVDNPKAIYDVLVRESESKKESEVELQGPRIELSDESSDEEEPKVDPAEEEVPKEAELALLKEEDREPPREAVQEAAHATSSEPTCHITSLKFIECENLGQGQPRRCKSCKSCKECSVRSQTMTLRESDNCAGPGAWSLGHEGEAVQGPS